MALSRIRKVSGRWWGSLRRNQNQNDDGCDYKCENEDTKLESSRSKSLLDEVHLEAQKSDVPSLANNKYHGMSQVFNGKNTKSPKITEPGGISEEADFPLLSEQEKLELTLLVKNKNISMDFILEMKEAFMLFDKNGDGFLSGKELGVLMRTMGRNPTEDEITNIMNEIDIDHDGKLDFSEFTIMMRDKLAGEDVEEEIRHAFSVFDRNGDGYISKSEFKHCMMNFGEQFTDEEVEEMIAEADTNNDGKIDYEEFSKMILGEIE